MYIALPLKVKWLLSGSEPMTSDGKEMRGNKIGMMKIRY